MIISHYWLRYCLGAVRQQAIAWANVELVLHHHKTSLSHNELIFTDTTRAYLDIACFLFQSQLFEGFEEDDSTFGTVTLVPRKSIKRLVLRSSNNSLLEDTTTSPNQSYSQLDSDLVSPVPAHQAVRQSSSERWVPWGSSSVSQSLALNHQLIWKSSIILIRADKC